MGSEVVVKDVALLVHIVNTLSSASLMGTLFRSEMTKTIVDHFKFNPKLGFLTHKTYAHGDFQLNMARDDASDNQLGGGCGQ